MLPAAPISSEPQNDNEDITLKWRGILASSLNQVLKQVHPSLRANVEAFYYVEDLIYNLLLRLCATRPHSIQDVDERIRKTFPTPIDKWALNEAKEALEKGRKKSQSQLVLPVEQIHQLLCKELLNYKVDFHMSMYIVAVLEYISADILKLAGNYVKNIHGQEFSRQEIRVAMFADKVLMDLCCQDDDSLSADFAQSELAANVPCTTSLTYEEIVKDLLSDEKQHLRDLHMIMKVFREEIYTLTPPVDYKLESLFCNISEIYELTVTFLGLIEDVVEMSEEKQVATFGSCFEELAEGAEFDVYSKYAKDIVQANSWEALSNLISNPEVSHALQSAGHGFREAVKYYLPKLLIAPVWHCFLYFEYIKHLKELTPVQEDKESLEQVEGLLRPLQMDLNDTMATLPKRDIVRTPGRKRRQAALEKSSEFQRSIEGWDSKELSQCCSEYYKEGILSKVSSGSKRPTDRKVFLFDGVLILCKPNHKRASVSVAAQVTSPTLPGEFRLKERFFIRKIEIIDREDTEELKNAFEIAPRDQPNVILTAQSSTEKNNWMADLVMLNTKSMLERTLDSILLDEEKKHPLVLPSPRIYRFAEEDNPINILLEERENAGVPHIKAATLCKLIERLTYHIYADPNFVRTFLISYRSFCSPQELLSLLEERYRIPDVESFSENSLREDGKRFRKEYMQPIQFRVLNVLRHWVDHHYYDFEKDHSLLDKLNVFLHSVYGKYMRKWVDSVLKIVHRKKLQTEQQREFTFAFDRSPPPIVWHIQADEQDWNILTLHPVEIARQLTLLQFDLFRAVKPSEVVGSVWTKKNKHQTSPNLLALIRHTNTFTLWLEQIIVDAENYEERVAIVIRIIETYIVLQELNNFNAIIAVASALLSAPVFRLNFTLQAVSARRHLEKAYEECTELISDHFQKYKEKLRSINPPCVPFFGMYLTNILHIEEGNPDLLTTNELINFSKRRKVAEIMVEIQQYQNQPYCLSVEPRIRNFLQLLDPLEDKTETEFNSYYFNKSLEVEPRTCKQVPRFPRKWPDLNLKSPGVKDRNLASRRDCPQPLTTNIIPHLVPPPISPRTSEGGTCDDTPRTPLLGPCTAQLDISGSCHGGSTNGSQSPSLTSCAPVSPSLFLPLTTASSPMPPPPLPPRSRKRETSFSDYSSSPHHFHTMSTVPLLPPRSNSSPPPLPPRPCPRKGSAGENISPIHQPNGIVRYLTSNDGQQHSTLTTHHVKSASMPDSMAQHTTQSNNNLTARVTGPPIFRPESSIPQLPPKPLKSNVAFQFNTNQA